MDDRTLDDLPPEDTITNFHQIPAVVDGETVLLSVLQVSNQVALNLAPDLAAKAPLASPAFTGNPTTSTPAAGDSDTTIPNTAWVQGELNADPLTAKTTPVDADLIRIADSAASFVGKKLTFANLKAWVLSFLPLTKVYISAEQTITSNGALTLAHGLGVAPSLVFPVLICKTAEFGYSVGDIIPAPLGTSTAGDDTRGASVEIGGTTNILVRYNTAGQVFSVVHKTSAGTVGLTNANWRLIMRAWA